METLNLDEIGIKHGTDKASVNGHDYLRTYQKILPVKCRSLLEIGIAKGASAEMWLEYYGQDELDLHYIDLFINPEFKSARWCRNRGIVPHIGSQSDINLLYSIKEKFEILIDDGSHVCQHQLVSFKHLFPNNLVEKGIYAIEDTHTSQPHEKYYWGYGVEEFEDTPLWLFKNFKETGKIQHKFFNDGESEMFESLIDTVDILCDEKLIIIKRK